jgi:hypothetical protein
MTFYGERRPEHEGVPEGWSTTYAAPDFVPPEGQMPAARQPAIHVRLVPNETLLPGPLGKHLGELVQSVLELGSDYGVSVEVDTSDKTRPGEMRGGASPVEAIDLAIYGLAAREGLRVVDQIVDSVVHWVLAHRSQDKVEPVLVSLYGPDGEIIKQVEIPQTGGPPRERPQ